MKTKTLAIDLLRIDGDTQSRISINQDAVDDYAEVIGESNGDWPFPPLDVFHDGAEFFVADGFHRYHSAQQCNRGSVPCRIHNGTAFEAAIFAMTANDQHGMRLTRADKRKCVERLLDGKKRTQKEIAELAGVSKRVVQTIVANRNPHSLQGKAQVAPPPTSSGVSSEAAAQHDPIDTGGCDPPVTSDAGPSPEEEKCPNCAGTKWDEDEDGWACSKCSHPYGEPAGDVDEDRVTTQRQKTVKTAEALMRAFDDLQFLKPKEVHASTITCCKGLISTAKGWK